MPYDQVWLYVLPIPLIEIFFLAVFSLVDSPKAKYTIVTTVPPEQTILCAMDNHETFKIIQDVYSTIVIAIGCYLGYLVRNVEGEMNEVKSILFAMYNFAFIGIVFFSIRLGVDLNAADLDIVKAVCIFMVTVFSSAAFIVPKLISVKNDREARYINMQHLRNDPNAYTESNMLRYSCNECRESIHLSEKTFKVLICSSNMGNAAPTLASMKAWIPEAGQCHKVQPLEKN